MGDCETGPFPSFSRRGGCAINKKIPFLSGADGVVRKFQQKQGALRGCLRRLRDLLLTTLSAPLRNGTVLLRRSHPFLKTETSEVDCQHPIAQSIHWFSTGLASIELSGDLCLSNDFM